METPSAQFHAAASYLSTTPSQTFTSTKLELYGLYKYVTVSPKPSTSRPSIFDMPGRAKWDAWDSAGKKYTEALHAQSRYLEIARNLGWSEETVLEPPKPEQSDPDSVWDDETQLNTGGRSGMGGSVSSMAPPEDQADRSIHGLAVSNDIPGLIELLGNHAEVDVNELDEFGYTPLHLASDRGNLSAVQLLLKKGANPDIKDSDGLSALELAQIAGQATVQECLQSFCS